MSKKIDFEKVTDRQKLELGKALLEYQFIMKYKNEIDNADFKEVYYRFYLSARWAVYGKNENRDAYFEVFKNLKEEPTLEVIVTKLHDELVAGNNNRQDKGKTKIGYDFSVATKMLHTHNPNLPIYDSKVHNYLKGEVPFNWQNVERDKKVEQIKKDYENLVEWYKQFQEKYDGKDWIDWFDKEFPNSGISDVKKIDFIIFALT